MKWSVLGLLILSSACAKMPHASQFKKWAKSAGGSVDHNKSPGEFVKNLREPLGIGQGNGTIFAVPQALALGLADRGFGDQTPNLYALNADGKVTTASNGVFEEVNKISYGFVAVLDRGSSPDMSKSYIYLVPTDGPVIEFISNDMYTTFVGEAPNGDLVFSDASVYRKASGQVEKLGTANELPYVYSFSGYFAVIKDSLSSGAPAQIFDVRDNTRFNVPNSTKVVALSDEWALLSGERILDMKTGDSAVIEQQLLVSESLLDDSGAVLLADFGCPATEDDVNTGFSLCHMNGSGATEAIASVQFFPADPRPGDGSPNSSSRYRNDILFGNETWLMVRELNKIRAVHKSDGVVVSVLEGINVVDVSLSGSLLYYVAEDAHGNPIVGSKDLSNASAPKEIKVSEKFKELIAL